MNGITLGSMPLTGALTALDMRLSSRNILTCSAISTDTFSCASLVDAPRWGVTTMLSRVRSFDPVGGSFSNTSRAAPAILFSFSASYNASSSISSPLATLRMTAFGFIRAIISLI